MQLARRAWQAWQHEAAAGLPQRQAWRRARRKASRVLSVRALIAWKQLPLLNQVRFAPHVATF